MHDGPSTADVLVAGRYRLREMIDRGGSDTVWRAADETVGRSVVLEQLSLDVLPQARIAATVHHPHLVSILDVVEEPDVLWLVCEDIPARSLAQLVADHGQMAPPVAALVGAQVASGLAAAHAAGVAHGALASNRILVVDAGTGPVAKISGLGGSSAADASTDVRSLGAALSAAVGDHVDEPVAALIGQLTDDDPAARPTAAQAHVELARIAAPATGPAETEPPGPPPRGRRRLRVLSAVAAAAAVVVALVLAVAMLATSASPALMPTASVPSVTPADDRALDPCSLVDVAALAPVGKATISPGYGLFSGCTVIIPLAADDLHVDVVLLNDSMAAEQIDIGLRNPVAPRVVPGTQEDGFCRRFVLVPGTPVVEVSAVRYGEGLTDRTDYCSVADIATEAVVVRLAGGGLARRSSDADRSALERTMACDLLDQASVTAAATAAGGDPSGVPVNGYAGWSCSWGDVSLDFIRVEAPGAPDFYGEPVTIAGRPGMTRTHEDTSCRAYIPQRYFIAEDGAMRAEYVRVIVEGTVDNATICRAAVDLAGRVATRLPAIG
jgi:hypothetical protein